jgi:hypothetical protein
MSTTFVMTPAIQWLEEKFLNDQREFSVMCARPLFEMIDDHTCGYYRNPERCSWSMADDESLQWRPRPTEAEALDYLFAFSEYDQEYYQAYVDNVAKNSELWNAIGK